jgi:hypothetical protein
MLNRRLDTVATVWPPRWMLSSWSNRSPRISRSSRLGTSILHRSPNGVNRRLRTSAVRVTVVPARRVPDLLQALPPVLGPERVAWLADRARLRFRAAA